MFDATTVQVRLSRRPRRQSRAPHLHCLRDRQRDVVGKAQDGQIISPKND